MSADLALPDRLDLPAAGPLATAILERRGGDLRLDASRVVHLGTPGLQVLLAASRTWRSDGRVLGIAALPETLARQIADLGLSVADLAAPAPEAGS